MKKETLDMVRQIIDRMNGWSKILVVMIPTVVIGLVGYGELKKEVENKASAIEVARIDERLKFIQDDVKEIKESIKQLNNKTK